MTRGSSYSEAIDDVLELLRGDIECSADREVLAQRIERMAGRPAARDSSHRIRAAMGGGK